MSGTADESTRDLVYTFILNNPGSYFREILRSLRIGTGNLQYVIENLQRDGKIMSIKVGAYKHFYPCELEESRRNLLSTLSQESPREILIFLASHPGSSQTNVARKISCSSPTARWYLQRLESLGLLWSRRHGAELKYYANTSIPELASLLERYRQGIWNRYADRMADLMRTFEGDDREEK